MKYSDLEMTLGQIEALSSEVIEGNAGALEAHVNLSLLEKAIKDAKKAIQDEAIAEAEMYSKNDPAKFHGYEVTSHSRKTPKFEYPKLIQDMKEEVKEYEKLAKMGKLGLTYASQDGEEIPVIPAKITHSYYIKMSVSK